MGQVCGLLIEILVRADASGNSILRIINMSKALVMIPTNADPEYQ